MVALKDLTGQKFGRLTVLKLSGSAPEGGAIWLCQCECGKTPSIRGASLRSGRSKSCGCFKSDQRRESMKKMNAKPK